MVVVLLVALASAVLKRVILALLVLPTSSTSSTSTKY